MGAYGTIMSKHAFDLQEIVAPVSNKDTVLLLLILTGKLNCIFGISKFHFDYFMFLR